jgi:uncharacterized protein involved in exopolysaccharide biosynthesis
MNPQLGAVTNEHEPELLGEVMVARPADLSEVEPLRSGQAFVHLRILWDQRAFLGRVTMWGFSLAFILAFLLPQSFESKTLLMPPEQANSNLASLVALAGGSGSSLGALAGNFLGMRTSGALFIGILSSRTVEDRIINQFNLRHVYHVSRMDLARKRLEADTYAIEDRRSGIIAITVTDGDPKRAAAIASAYVNELDRLVAQLNTSTAHRERVFLEERLKSIKQDLDSAARDFSDFSSKNAAIDIKEQGKAMMDAAAKLEGELIAAQSEREGLRQIYSDENVRVRALGARIAELQKSLAQIGGGASDSATSSNLQDGPGYPSLRQLPLLGVTYAELYRRSKSQETLYDLFTQQYELAKVQEAKETPSVKVLDPPNVPEKKSFPPRLLIMFLGAVLSFVFGALWLVAHNAWQETDSQNPAKSFLREVYAGVRTDLRLVSSRGTRFRQMRDKIMKFKTHNE